MATVKELKLKINSELNGQYSSNEISSLSKTLFSHFLNFSSTQYLLNDDVTIPLVEEKYFNDAIKRLLAHEPIQHITGNCEFFGLPFLVNSDVLIPRPETEELISWIKEMTHNPLAIADFCTGSGCISIALKSIFNAANVTGFDISEKALEMAQRNSVANKLPVTFEQVDVLKYLPDSSKRYDVVVSNPPYIRESEKSEMHTNVLNFEPHLALFVDNENPLIFYKKIAEIASIELKTKGLLFFEINEAFGKETVEMLEGAGFKEIILKQDINGKDRMIMAKKS